MLGGTLLCWGAVAYPAYLLGGESAVVFSAAAAGLCLVPALATLAWAEGVYRQSPEQYLLMVLGGTGVRLFAVLGGAVALNRALTYFQRPGFLPWVGLFYLLTLALEMTLMLAGRTKTVAPARTPAPGSWNKGENG
jgi:hypothetical protein